MECLSVLCQAAFSNARVVLLESPGYEWLLPKGDQRIGYLGIGSEAKTVVFTLDQTVNNFN